MTGAAPARSGSGKRRQARQTQRSVWIDLASGEMKWRTRGAIGSGGSTAADAADAARKGVPFDVLGAEFGHHGEDCTFETLVKRFKVKDRRVKLIAEIVHEADLHDGKFTRDESTGVDLAIRGLAEATSDDHDLLERGMALFDGLYKVLKQKA